MPIVILDFINKTVINAGSSSDDDKRYQEFLAQQSQQLTAQGHPPRA